LLFTDVAGSTELGEARDPEAVRAVMDQMFALARTVIERHGGLVEKFVGDAVMAAFGLPQVREDDALRAIRAADEIRRELAALNNELEPEWGSGSQSAPASTPGRSSPATSPRARRLPPVHRQTHSP
jgi:class 3 adenylate cyclase